MSGKISQLVLLPVDVPALLPRLLLRHNLSQAQYGLSLITMEFCDGVLLKVTYAFEQLVDVCGKEPTPIYLPTAELKDIQGTGKERFV